MKSIKLCESRLTAGQSFYVNHISGERPLQWDHLTHLTILPTTNVKVNLSFYGTHESESESFFLKNSSTSKSFFFTNISGERPLQWDHLTHLTTLPSVKVKVIFLSISLRMKPPSVKVKLKFSFHSTHDESES